jgi:hypothetical protein
MIGQDSSIQPPTGRARIRSQNPATLPLALLARDVHLQQIPERTRLPIRGERVRHSPRPCHPRRTPGTIIEDEEMDEESAGEFFDVLDVFDGRADAVNDDDPPLKVDKKLQARQTRATEVEGEEEWRERKTWM